MQIPPRASYTDTFEHAFDIKGRVTVPSDWRSETFEPHLHAFPSKEKCVKIYPASYLGRLQEQLSGLKMDDPQRKRVELLASLAQNASWDQQGRIMIKEKLRSMAGIKKNAVLVGRLDHFEIWAREEWDALPALDTTLEDAAALLGL
ncbi:MAG: division/cell wall cluster transcriptional repressor MraZ [Candidatus Methylacidiphilales bacterium]|nr:division/cell wall cluster transcriptional repressor MraZ [Candidatus Methylacidiphilales bacterium]